MSEVDRRAFLVAAAGLLAAPLARAQQRSDQAHVIGILEYGTRADFEPELVPFKEALREGGFVEGRNLRIEYRFADNDYRKVNSLAEDLVRARVEVIFAPMTWAVHGARSATKTIPIVFSQVNDPVALRFVQSLAKPGGNITGVSPASAELTAKRVQLMRELFPSAHRFGLIYDEDAARACQVELKQVGQAGRQLGVEVSNYPYLARGDLEGAFKNAQRSGAAAVLVPTTYEARRVRGEFVAQSAGSRIPTIHSGSKAVEAGGLMSYGPHAGWGSRRGGDYVARILKGAKPTELPVERPNTYELVVNLKTARDMGIRIPQAILARADRVIE